MTGPLQVRAARSAGLAETDDPVVLRVEGDSFLHLFGAGYADYTWTVFVDAAKSLGGRAVGVNALPASLTAAKAAAHA